MVGRRKGASTALSILLLLAPVAIGTALAEDRDDEMVVLDGERSFEGASWIAWRVKAPEDADERLRAMSYAEIGDREDASATTLHCFKYDKEFTDLTFGVFWTRMATITNEVSIGEVEVDLEDGPGGLMGMGCAGDLVPGGEVVLVSQAGADTDISGTFELRGDDRIQVLGVETGDSLYALAEDFDGPVNVVTRTATDTPYWAYMHSKVVHDAHIDMDVDGYLLGTFEGQTNSGQLEMGFEGPKGSFFDGQFTGPDRYLYIYAGPEHLPRAQLYGTPAGSYDIQIPHHVDEWDRNPFGSNACSDLWGQCDWIYTPLLVGDVEVPPR